MNEEHRVLLLFLTHEDDLALIPFHQIYQEKYNHLVITFQFDSELPEDFKAVLEKWEGYVKNH